MSFISKTFRLFLVVLVISVVILFALFLIGYFTDNKRNEFVLDDSIFVKAKTSQEIALEPDYINQSIIDRQILEKNKDNQKELEKIDFVQGTIYFSGGSKQKLGNGIEFWLERDSQGNYYDSNLMRFRTGDLVLLEKSNLGDYYVIVRQKQK